MPVHISIITDLEKKFLCIHEKIHFWQDFRVWKCVPIINIKNAIKRKFNFKIEISVVDIFDKINPFQKRWKITFLSFYFNKDTFFSISKIYVHRKYIFFNFLKSSLHYMYESLIQTVCFIKYVSEMFAKFALPNKIPCR